MLDGEFGSEDTFCLPATHAHMFNIHAATHISEIALPSAQIAKSRQPQLASYILNSSLLDFFSHDFTALVPQQRCQCDSV